MMNMRSTCHCVALMVVLLTPGLSRADESAPNLIGTWTSVAGEVGHWSGVLKPLGDTVGTLQVKEQLGGVFRGTMTYDNEESGPKFEGAAGISHKQSETVLGVIDWDGHSIVWVDYKDETVHRAQLKNANLMEVIAFETGENTVVNRMIMVRK